MALYGSGSSAVVVSGWSGARCETWDGPIRRAAGDTPVTGRCVLQPGNPPTAAAHSSRRGARTGTANRDCAATGHAPLPAGPRSSQGFNPASGRSALCRSPWLLRLRVRLRCPWRHFSGFHAVICKQRSLRIRTRRNRRLRKWRQANGKKKGPRKRHGGNALTLGPSYCPDYRNLRDYRQRRRDRNYDAGNATQQLIKCWLNTAARQVSGAELRSGGAAADQAPFLAALRRWRLTRCSM